MQKEKIPEARNKIYWETREPDGTILLLVARWMVMDRDWSYRVL